MGTWRMQIPFPIAEASTPRRPGSQSHAPPTSHSQSRQLQMPAHPPVPLAPSLALLSLTRNPQSRPGSSVPDPNSPSPPHFPNVCASLPKGHSPGWGHFGWPPEKNPEQYPGDAGTDEPDPVCGGLTFTCLGSPLPPGPAPSAPRAGPLVLCPPQGQPPARWPRATGRTKQRSSHETSPRTRATQTMEKKGNGDKRKQILGGGGKYKEYFLKRILTRKAIIVLGGEKRAWEIHAICPIGDQKQFLSNSLWEGNPARAKKHFQETNVKGRDRRRPSLLPLGCSSRPHATATHQAEGAGRQRTATQEPR